MGLAESLDRELEEMSAADTSQETLPSISGKLEGERNSNSLPGLLTTRCREEKGDIGKGFAIRIFYLRDLILSVVRWKGSSKRI